VGPTQPRV